MSLISPVDNGYLNNCTVDFIWHETDDNVSGVDYYVLQYALDNGFTQGLVETTLIDTVCTAALTDTLYYWHVKAIDLVSNEGRWSNIWWFEIDTTRPTPSKPILVAPDSGDYLNETDVVLQWSAVVFESTIGLSADNKLNEINVTPINKRFKDGAKLVKESESSSAPIFYIVQVDTNELFSSPIVWDTINMTYDSLILGEDKHHWRVKPFDLAGNEGEWSNVWWFEIDTTPPEPPVPQSPEDNAYFNDTIVVFNWSQAIKSPLGYYILQIAEDTVFTQIIISDTTVETTDTVSLQHGRCYWHLCAVDLAENSSDWTERRAVTIDIVPPQISDVTIWPDTSFAGPYPVNAKVEEEWIDSVFLYYKFNADWLSSPMSPIAGDTIYTDTIPECDTSVTIHYYILARDKATNVATNPVNAPDSVYTFTVSVVSILESLTIPDWFVTKPIYPNPARKILNIEYGVPSDQQVKIVIYDPSGREIAVVTDKLHRTGYYKIKHQLNLTSGIYFVKIELNGENFVRKFVVVK